MNEPAIPGMWAIRVLFDDKLKLVDGLSMSNLLRRLCDQHLVGTKEWMSCSWFALSLLIYPDQYTVNLGKLPELENMLRMAYRGEPVNSTQWSKAIRHCRDLGVKSGGTAANVWLWSHGDEVDDEPTSMTCAYRTWATIVAMPLSCRELPSEAADAWRLRGKQDALGRPVILDGLNSREANRAVTKYGCKKYLPEAPSDMLGGPLAYVEGYMGAL